MILCSPTPAAIIKAALLARLCNDLPCLRDHRQGLGLFMHTQLQDADKFDMHTLLQRLNEEHQVDMSWVTAHPGQTLIHHIAANLRFRSEDHATVIFAALEQAMSCGPAYCLHGIDDISRLFIARTRIVWHEIHRMTGFIRFSPGADEHTLIAKPKLFHDTADMILRKFALRYPDVRLILILPEHALILERDGCFTQTSVEDYVRYIENDDFSDTWATYYQSQYITARKNMKLAAKVIPKRYWDWLSEGAWLQQES